MHLPATLFPHQNRLTFPAYALLALFCLSVFLPGFFTLPPIDRDEARFAQASKQMMETGDLVTIRFQDEARNKKPAGIYWLQAGFAKLAGVVGISDNTIWPYRLPSLLGALLAVLLTAAVGSKLFNTQIGFVAGILLAGSLLLNVEARLAKTDAALLACILSCMFVLAKAYLQAADKKLKNKDFLLFWGGLAAGVLIKGPIILLPVLGTLLYLKLAKEKLGFLKKLKPLLGLPLCLLLISPWFILIAIETNGAFYREAGGGDLLAKITHGQNWGAHNWLVGLPGLHALAAPVLLWPASLPLLLAFPWVWKSRNEKPVRFALAWIVPVWLVFEFTLTKQLHYTLPTYPALMLLAAAWIFADLKDSNPRWWRTLVLIAWGGVTLALTALPSFLPVLAERTLFFFSLVLASLVIGACIAALFLFGQEKLSLALSPLPLASFAFMLCLFGFVLPNVKRPFVSTQIVAALPEAVAPCPATVPATSSYKEPSLVFLAGTRTSFLNGPVAVAEVMRSEPCFAGVIDKEEDAAFLQHAQDIHLDLEAPQEIEGFNYGNGHEVHLLVYGRKP
jgi:4-amino-4-deoxy-L-arabinose transferase-like glycosyltransferase